MLGLVFGLSDNSPVTVFLHVVNTTFIENEAVYAGAGVYVT